LRSLRLEHSRNTELELYLAVHKCEGLQRGFYNYDTGEHALVPIRVREKKFELLLKTAALAMGEIAYALILKNVGVLIQTLYLMAGDMGLSGCAIGMRISICSRN
jgi:hypothetical protein